MVSREQLEAMLSRVRTSISHFGPSDYGSKLREDEAILTLSLKALDTERDAALGRELLSHFVAEDGSLLTEAERGYADDIVKDLARFVAAHLREEQKGGG